MTFPWPGVRQSQGNLVLTNLTIILSIVAYEIGVNNKKNPSRRRNDVDNERLIVPGFARYVALTTLCVGLSVWGIVAQGGLKAVVVTRNETKQEFSHVITGSGRLVNVALQRYPPFIALLVSTYLVFYKRYHSGRRRLLFLIFLFLIGFNFIANYPPSLPRLNLGSEALAFAILLIGARWRLKAPFVMMMVVALTVLFPYLDYFRSATGYSAKDIRSPVEVLISKPDYDAFQMISNTIAVVDDQGVDHGYHILGSVFFFVPRAIWADKPYGTGQSIGELVGYSFLNLSAPLWGELYLAGGLAVMLLGFWLYGRATSRLEESVSRASDPQMVVLAYAAGYQIFLLRGDLMNAVAYASLSVLIIGCFLMGVGKPPLQPN